MKNATLSTFAALGTLTIALAFSSCSRETLISARGTDEVKFTGDVARRITRVGGTEWDKGDAVGIYMVQAANPTAYEYENKKYTVNATGGTAAFIPDDGTVMKYPKNPQTGEKVQFMAYYPFTETSNIAGGKVPITVASQSNLSAIDLLYSPLDKKYDRGDKGAVPLLFSHKLVKLVFNVTNDIWVEEPAENGMKVDITNQYTTGTLDLNDAGAVASTGNTGTLRAEAASSTTKTITITAIVLPSDNLSAVTLTFTNNAGKTFSMGVPTDQTAKWDGGRCATYDVTLKSGERQSEIEGTITDWIYDSKLSGEANENQ